MCESNTVPASPDGDAGFLMPQPTCESETCEKQCYTVHRYDGGDVDGILNLCSPCLIELLKDRGVLTVTYAIAKRATVVPMREV